MAWTEIDSQGVAVILAELRGFLERHGLELTSDLVIREAHAEHDVIDMAHMLGGEVT